MKITIEVDAATAARIEAELAYLKERGVAATFQEVAHAATIEGLVSRERARGAKGPAPKVSDLTVHELAEAMGVWDLAATRANQRRAMEASAEAMASAVAQLGDAKGLAAVAAPLRLKTCEELDRFSAAAHATFHANGPGMTLVVLAAWVDENRYTPMKENGVDPARHN